MRTEALSPRRAELLRLINARLAAAEAHDHEGAEYDAAEDALEAFVATVYATPPANIDDLVIRADITRYCSERWADFDEHTFYGTELADAVYHLAQTEPLQYSRATLFGRDYKPHAGEVTIRAWINRLGPASVLRASL